MEGYIDAPYFNVMILLLNVELMYTWIPGLEAAEIRTKKTPLKGMFYQRFK